MSPKHVEKSSLKTEKCNLVLMILVLILTLALAFMWKVAEQEPEKVIEKVYVEIPVIQYVEKPSSLAEEPEEIETVELEGAELYASYVDEITSTIYTDVDPLLVKAIIQNESRYIPDAVNGKSGTTGLMQISPKWHTVRAESLGVTDLKDPYGNILVGCDILHDLYQTHSKEYSLSVYAGGYAYADKYKDSKSPYQQLIESIMQQISDGTIVIGGD